MTMTIGLFAFPEMEMLDYAGPYQVFASASRIAAASTGREAFSLLTIAPSLRAVTVRAGATVLPQAGIGDHPALDCLILPGGMAGVAPLLDDAGVIGWIKAQADTVPIIASVCTGAFLLAATGLLDGLEATTHHSYSEEFARRYPAITMVSQRRWVESGRFVTAAGLSAGIDMTCRLVERLATRDLSVATAKVLEL